MKAKIPFLKSSTSGCHLQRFRSCFVVIGDERSPITLMGTFHVPCNYDYDTLLYTSLVEDLSICLNETDLL